MDRSYRYRLYPNRRQTTALQEMLEGHRQLYNAALQERREAWRMGRVSVSYPMQANQLRDVRACDPQIAALNYSSCQQTLRRLDKAFAAFFRRVRAGETAGYPRYKNRRRWKSVVFVYGDGISLQDGRLYLQHIGRVRIRLHRPLPEGAVVKQVVVQRTSADEWYATLQIEAPDVQVEPRTEPSVGIDLGLEYLIALSTGEVISNPRWFRATEQALALAQQQQARCVRGSRRSLELGRRIARWHELVARQRRDWQHKISRRLVQDYGLIAVEDLSIQGLARSRLAKSVHDAGWSSFLDMLRYKVVETGSQVVAVVATGTSQDCSCCGGHVPKTLADRVHHCPHCGFTALRDVNAALNVLARSTARTGPPRKGLLVPEGLGSSISPRIEVAGSRLL